MPVKMGSGDITCDWCGKYMKNTDSGLLGSLAGAAGLGLVTAAAAKTQKHFCSKKCKLAYEASQGNGQVGVATGGGGAPIVVQKTGMFAEAMKGSSLQMQAQIDAAKAKQAEKVADKQRNISTLDSIIEMRFDGSSDDISGDLNSLLARFKQTKSGLLASKDEKAIRTTILEKLEFGIMKLQKTDAESASFFQKKFDELKK
jgi:hypothetical protein